MICECALAADHFANNANFLYSSYLPLFMQCQTFTIHISSITLPNLEHWELENITIFVLMHRLLQNYQTGYN